jgi:hypothetical protein
MNRIMRPLRPPQKRDLQGKSRRVRGPRPLGAAMDSSAFAGARSTATTGHRPRSTTSARSRRHGEAHLLGSMIRHRGTHCGTLKKCRLQEK